MLKYTLPLVWGHDLDNVVGTGQNITLANPVKVHELHMLYSNDGDWDSEYFRGICAHRS